MLAGLTPASVRAVLDRIASGDPHVPPPLEPLLPALAETVLLWAAGGRRVMVVHDEQSALTDGRLRRLREVLGVDARGRPVLVGLVAVDSRDDPRVQVADMLAGLARRAPADDDALAPFVADTSLR